MPVTNYTTINGVIVHENRNGVQRNYRPDTLGNTIALTDATTTTDTWVYWPYGEVRTRTGTTATPFQFVGTLGYYQNTGSNLAYVRARFYQATRGRWATVDPLWAFSASHVARIVSCSDVSYIYANAQPTQKVDPSGWMPWDYVYGHWCGLKQPPTGIRPKPKDAVDACCRMHDDCLGCGLQALLMFALCACAIILCLQSARFSCGFDIECWAKSTLMISAFKLACPGLMAVA